MPCSPPLATWLSRKTGRPAFEGPVLYACACCQEAPCYTLDDPQPVVLCARCSDHVPGAWKRGKVPGHKFEVVGCAMCRCKTFPSEQWLGIACLRKVMN